jgi:biotin operon repressor
MLEHMKVARWDMRLTDREVLAALALGTPTSQRDLAVKFGCGTATITRSIRRLKLAGVIEAVRGGRRVPMEWRVKQQ